MIQFLVRSRWTEVEVARQVAAIIGEPNAYVERPNCCPYKKDNGSWQLDGGNDWFLRKVEGESAYTLEYRYKTPERQAALEGLKLFLEVIAFS